MPFVYEFHLNNAKLKNVELGFKTHRKWEEALDDIHLSLPFYKSSTPLSQLGLLRVRVGRVDNYNSSIELESQESEYLIISDRVTPSTKFGEYRHDITAIEYTAKLDYYINRSLAFTRPTETNQLAPFELMNTQFMYNNTVTNTFIQKVFMKPIEIKSTYKAGSIVIPQVGLATQATVVAGIDSMNAQYRESRVYIETNMPGNYKQWISDGTAILNMVEGEWYIDYGIELRDFTGLPNGDYVVYRYYIKVIGNDNLTMYDLLNTVRHGISKFGGIETKDYHNLTRIFDIDPQYEEYLKGIQAPQIYLGEATARQTLVYILSYINALPRLQHGDEGEDLLTLELFNESVGTFNIDDVVGFTSSQNTNQIGTRSYSPLKQMLPNDLNEETISTPSQTSWQTPRSTSIQMTDDKFELKLPSGHALYMPKKFEYLAQQVRIHGLYNQSPSDYVYNNFTTDLTSRLIYIDEWRLKNVTPNFPSITPSLMGDTHAGMRINMVDNLYWQVGDTSIKLSDVYGTLFQDNLINNVINGAIVEHFMRNNFEPMFSTNPSDTAPLVIGYNMTISRQSSYRNYPFRLKYISLEDVNIMQDKEDLSQVDFYSEMRNNQDEEIANISRQSRKSYGNLQRTGNVENTFTKYHKTLGDIYRVGMKDINGYTITDTIIEYYNDFVKVTYGITKDHNRISQATFVDQTYRWRDNYAKTVLKRHENYTDYLMVVPKNDTEIEPDFSTILGITYDVEATIVDTLRSGVPSYKSKATVALVRTDGMLLAEPEEEYKRKALMIPVASYGIKQGFAFTLGFEDNQVAGDGLVNKGGNWYNQAVRYTNIDGTFNEFAFAIMNDKTFISDDEQTYPMVDELTMDEFYFMNKVYANGIKVPELNISGVNPLIVKKDVMTNFKLTYQIQMLSYYVGLYIFGQKFFSENFIVDNNDDLTTRDIYLYVFKDGQRFELFNDLLIPDNYDSRIKLTSSNLTYNGITNEVTFGGISLSDVTSWAIGTDNRDLFIACNEALNGFKIVRRHFRPHVQEIGKPEFIVYQHTLNATQVLNANISYSRGNAVNVNMDGQIKLGFDYSFHKGLIISETVDVPLIMNESIIYFRDNSVQYGIDKTLILTDGIDYWRTNNPHLDINSIIKNNISISYSTSTQGSNNINTTQVLNVNISYNKVIKTANPIITNVSQTTSGIRKITSWSVFNMDTETATIYSDPNTTPTTNRGNATYNASIGVSVTETVVPSPYIIFAKAKAGDKEESDEVSYTYW